MIPEIESYMFLNSSCVIVWKQKTRIESFSFCETPPKGSDGSL